MVWFFLILYLITLVECNYGFIGYSEEAFAEKKSHCTFAVASTQSGNQDPQAARAQEGVWDSSETSLEGRKLFGPHCGGDGAVNSGLALLCVLENEQSQHAEVCLLWGSSGRTETIQRTSRRRSTQRVQEGVLNLGTIQDGTAEGTGTTHPGQRTGKIMDRLRGAMDAGTLRDRRHPRRSRRTSKASIQYRHQSHLGTLSTGEIK